MRPASTRSASCGARLPPPGARGGDARLVAPAARAAGRARRAHRGLGVHRHAGCARGCPRRRSGPPRRRRLRARALVDRQGVPDPRARAPQGAGRRGVPALRADGLDLTDACAVVATVGTTSSTAVDPVAAVAELAAAGGVWLHVDAAYAGSAAVCPSCVVHFAGWERADSIGVNPHKWLFTPLDCSAFLWRRPDDLRRAFSLVPEYLRVRHSEDVVSLSEFASPLGRRFRALKLWATLRCFGREGLQALIREHVRLAGSSSGGWGTRLGGRFGHAAVSRSCASGRPVATRRTRRSCGASARRGRAGLVRPSLVRRERRSDLQHLATPARRQAGRPCARARTASARPLRTPRPCPAVTERDGQRLALESRSTPSAKAVIRRPTPGRPAPARDRARQRMPGRALRPRVGHPLPARPAHAGDERVAERAAASARHVWLRHRGIAGRGTIGANGLVHVEEKRRRRGSAATRRRRSGICTRP